MQATGELANTGAGRPGFGLFERRSNSLRAVVEVKAPEEPTPDTADGRQVSGYWDHYGYVLVTNYRDFLLVVRQPDGTPRVEGRFQLAANVEAFWRTKPAALADLNGEGLVDFLSGVLA